MSCPWEKRFAQRTKRMGSSIIRELLKFTQQPDVISFAGGLPAGELFPIERFQEATQRVLRDQGEAALQYSTTEGYLPLRELIVARMNRYGLHITPDNVLITSGAQQALDIIGKLLLDPGDLVLTEEPTYLGALQAWRAYQASYITVPIDADGIVVDDRLENALRAGPKMMYVLPNFQNPGGVTLSAERREQLIAIADQFGVPIIEDDPYGELRYEGESLPPLIAVDAWRHGRFTTKTDDVCNGEVLYLGTISKTLAPGFRLGWMIGPQQVIRQCVMAKQGMDLHSSTFSQMVVYEAAKDGFIDEHVDLIRRVYRERRDVMLAALETHMPPGVTWTRPHGGLFLWLKFPEQVDAMAMLDTAVAHKVAYVPGSAFYPATADSQTSGHNTARFNFSNANPDEIREGIRRLAQVLEETLSPSMAIH